ncbi:hypothetical protein PR048_030226 [Dryococelus australis]|uniref:Uncharacterized protein n=1 Tax=Dryococelus australis TaxID=614101 RepID=A0ABQ9G8C4_9NEOP|nr:hypothetical protein PR048_030226 [Dryococelus australis]
MTKMGAVTQDTIVATTVHECQWPGHSPPTTAIQARSPGRFILGFSLLGIVLDDVACPVGFLRVLLFSPALAFQHCSILGSYFMSYLGMMGTYESQHEYQSLGGIRNIFTKYTLLCKQLNCGHKILASSPLTQNLCSKPARLVFKWPHNLRNKLVHPKLPPNSIVSNITTARVLILAIAHFVALVLYTSLPPSTADSPIRLIPSMAATTVQQKIAYVQPKGPVWLVG